MKRTRGEAERIMQQLTAQKHQIVVETVTTRHFVDPASKRRMKGCKIAFRRQVIVPRKVKSSEI